jgi:hypothetical protein
LSLKLPLMFFYAIISSLVQLPKDLYLKGIKNCNKAINVPYGTQSSSTPISVRPKNIGIVQRTLENRLMTAFPETTESQVKQFQDTFTDLLSEDAWKKTRTRVIALNGYSKKSSNSVFSLIVLSNVNVPDGVVFKISLQTSYSSMEYSNSFIYITQYDVEGDNIVNAKIPDFKNFQEVMVCVESVAPFYYGSALFSYTDFVNPAINYIKANSAQISKRLRFDNSEVLSAIAEFKKNGAYDMQSLLARIRKVCLSTPTPLPTPEVQEPVTPAVKNEKDCDGKPKPKRFFRKKRLGIHRKRQDV